LAVLVFRYALDPASKTPGLLGLAEYTYAYSFYLFFDFAGYSAFAIGLGRFLGIHVPENFNRPWLSRDFKDMWNRWHISLSWWLRDHVYMRFLLKAGKSKWFGGNRQIASYVGQLLTMGLMGAWHGLTPHYLVYGLYQAAMLVVSDLIGRWNHQGRFIPDTPLSQAASIFATFNLFCFGLLIFSGHLFW
jgi:membrane protein involved in D-alanine export